MEQEGEFSTVNNRKSCKGELYRPTIVLMESFNKYQPHRALGGCSERFYGPPPRLRRGKRDSASHLDPVKSDYEWKHKFDTSLPNVPCSIVT